MSTPLEHETGKTKTSSSWLQRMAANLGFTSGVTLRETLESAIQEMGAEDDQSLSPQERLMLLNVLEFGETKVSEVMIPRADIVAVEENQTVAELLNLFARIGHSRVPVFRESLDNPVGMVHIKDAIAWVTRGAKLSLQDEAALERAVQSLDLSRSALRATIASAKLVREALFVPSSMSALALLAKMKQKRIHLAIVVDEFGGTDGLATFQDVVEAITGDIDDEHDDSKALAIGVENDAFVASARTPIVDVELALGMSLATNGIPENVETLGGLILATVGSVPKRGQIIPHPAGVTFEILEAGPR
ncbi:MAG TPA: hemolysin family protein, partial [Rhodomicrobium sp.]|nr:hemolysin family protein [Rhodomicrobium sp.]